MIRLHYGGYVCGPVFKEVMRAALTKLNVPEEPMNPEAEKEPAIIAAKPKEKPAVAPVVYDADTIVERIEPDKLDESLEALLIPIEGLTLVKADGAPIKDDRILPDFSGMTKSQVRTQLRSLGLTWDPQGTGWVIAQEPPPGTPVSQVALCRLIFSQGDAERTEDAVDISL
jgi:hypothetical protein